MRIAVVLPNRKHLDTAGVRIRYQRIEPALRRLGHRLDVTFLDDYAPSTRIDADVHLFCKCQDARSVILARRLATEGRLAGLDLFDDYFSQREDSRLAPHRRWWEEMRPWVGFLLCATPAMAERLGALAPGMPVHLLNDPFEPFDPQAVAALVEAKVERVRRTGVIEVAWFGMGDNLLFPVGLDDLSAFGRDLAELRATGLRPRLRVLTNRRAMTPERMEGLARLPIPTELGLWSVEAERELLRDSLVAVLPVNAHPFSTVKSLNRAVTALTSGTQVLSLGHPLYAALGAFLYRSVPELLDDVARGAPRLRRDTMPGFQGILARHGAPDVEAKRLASFLRGLPAPPRHSEARPGVLVHGTVFDAAVGEFARQQGWLSVAGLFGEETSDADISLAKEADGTAVALLSERASAALGASDRGRLRPFADADGVGRSALALPVPALPTFGSGGLAEGIVRYPAVLAEARRLLASILPGRPLLLSEPAAPFAAPGFESPRT